MLQLSQTDLSTLEATATTAAAYLDSCDSGAKFVRLDPTYYQACGRLLRTEEDRGIITLLDRRLVTQRYGKAILNALPPFRREIS